MEEMTVSNEKYLALIRPAACCLALLTSFVLLGCGPNSYHAHFLVSWSIDGTLAAVVPSIFDDNVAESGVWVVDPASGKTRSIYRAPEGYACFQPQWSPFGPEVLFGVFKKDGDDENGSGTVISLWIARQEGYGARKVGEAVVNRDDDSVLMPNGIAWGPNPGTIIAEQRVDDVRSTAVLLDLCTGARRPILPHPSERYAIEISPSRKLITAVLLGSEEEPAELWVADFAEPIWRRLGYVSPDPEMIDQHSPLIYWTPDSSAILVVEAERSAGTTETTRHFASCIAVETGAVTAFETGRMNAPLRWKGASELCYSADGGVSGAGIFRLDLRSGSRALVEAGEGIRLLYVDSNSGAITFFTQDSVDGAAHKETNLFRFYTCSDSCTEWRELMPPLLAEDLGWTVSRDGRRAIFFASEHPVISLDLPRGLHRRSLALIPQYDAAGSGPF
jgi:hypothetical protein